MTSARRRALAVVPGRLLWQPLASVAVADTHPLFGRMIDTIWKRISTTHEWVQGIGLLMAFIVGLAGLSGAIAALLAIPDGLLLLSFRLMKSHPNRADWRQDAVVLLFLILIGTFVFGVLYLRP